MGTRNLTVVKAKGEYRIAQYGQWDGYPEGQGRIALTFLHSKKRRKNLLEASLKCTFASDAELSEIGNKWEKEGDSFPKNNPQWNRDTGAGILALVAASDGLKLKNSLEFSGDSLFCEWAYVVDFDAGTFEVYKGFNKKPIPETERFYLIPKREKSEYYQIKLLKSYPLDALPTLSTFLKECSGE